MHNPANNNGKVDSYAARTASVFEKALQGFSIGDLPYSDVQAYLEHLLMSGASAEELWKVLQRHERVEPLPEYAHLEISRVLTDSTVAPAGQEPPAADPDPAPAENPAFGNVTSVLTAPATSGALEELRELRKERRALREVLAARDATIEELEAELAFERASRARAT